MTVPSETSRTIYAGNGSTTAFSTGFYFQKAAQLKVTLTPAVGTPVVQTLGVHYTVTAPAQGSGLPGTVTMLVAPASGATLTIERDVDFTQLTSLRTIGPFSPQVHEDLADLLVFMVQELQRKVTDLQGQGTPGSVIAGNGSSFTGSVLNIGAGTGIQVNADDVAIAFTTTVPPTVSGAAGAAGTASDPAHRDHTHQVTTGAPSALVAGGSGATGAGPALANNDHVHAMPVGAPVAVDAAVAVTGASGNFADASHKHQVSTGSVSAITDSTNVDGTANTLARSDHQHAHGNRGGGSLHADANGVASGFMAPWMYNALVNLSTGSDTVKTVNTVTPTQISTWTPANNTAEHIDVRVVGKKSGAADAAMYHREFVVTNNGGVLSLVGSVVNVAEQESNPAWDIQISLVGTAVVVKVVGVADGGSIDWRSSYRRVIAP